MKKIIAILVSVFMLFTIASSGAVATVNPKMVTASITKCFTFADDVNTPKFLVFFGKVTNTTKYTATINKMTINANITSVVAGNFKGTFHFTPGMVSQLSFKNSFPKTIKPNSFILYKLITATGTMDLKMMTQPFALSEYSKSTKSVDFTITAKTTKVSKLYTKASNTSKVLKTLKAKVSVTVLGTPVKTYTKVKVGSTTGYVLTANIK